MLAAGWSETWQKHYAVCLETIIASQKNIIAIFLLYLIDASVEKSSRAEYIFKQKHEHRWQTAFSNTDFELELFSKWTLCQLNGHIQHFVR